MKLSNAFTLLLFVQSTFSILMSLKIEGQGTNGQDASQLDKGLTGVDNHERSDEDRKLSDLRFMTESIDNASEVEYDEDNASSPTSSHPTRMRIKKEKYLDIEQDYPIECVEYHVFRDDSLKQVVDKFQMSVSDLSLLNPDVSLPTVEFGTPLCVAGKMKAKYEQRNNLRGKMIGKQPSNLIQYKTTPGFDSCQKFLHNTEPPLSMLEFVELNPHVSCVAMQTTSQTVFLPEGTIVLGSENDKYLPNDDQDCLFGAWSEWSACEGGTKTRNRNIYTEARGDGMQCPASHETSTCESSNDDNRNLSQVDNPRALGSSDQCMAVADGCSVPVGEPYGIFTPACNFHDICWSCTEPKNWGYSESHCNNLWLGYMKNTCAGYWANPFDKFWCDLMAEFYYIGVEIGGSDNNEQASCPPIHHVLNSKLAGKHIGYSVPDGCDCPGTSCLYRGGPPSCWTDGTICGAGTTCNNCCNGYSWWTGKVFTACGYEPCWGSGTVCGIGTTCNSCCHGADCPWYQFGICTCY